MALSTVPTTAEVKSRVNLRPEQINPLYGGQGATAEQANTAYEVDIAARITEQAAIAEILLRTGYTASEIEAFTEPQTTVVETAVLLLTASDLNDSAGQYNDAYQAEANNLRERGMALLNALINGKSDMADGDGLGAQMLTITVGEDFPSDEYAA